MTIAAMTDTEISPATRLVVRVAKIPHDHPSSALSVLDLLSADVSGQDDEHLWCGHGRQMVGWGSALTLAVSGSNAIREAARAWDDLRAQAEVVCMCQPACDDDELPALPVAFASFAFSARSEGYLIVPRVAVIEIPPVPDTRTAWGFPWGGLGPARGRRYLVTTTLGDEAPCDPFAVMDTLPSAPWAERRDAAPWGELSTLPGRMTQQQWTDQVAQVVEALKGGVAQKVVMSRDMIVRSSTPIDRRAVIQRLVELYPTTWAYSVRGMVGATPEMLAAMSGGRVSSRVLAGTIRPGQGAELMQSMKDRTEHMFAVESVARALAPMTSTLNVPEAPMILDLPNVTHLATDVEGELSAGNLLDVIAALHPTAAVCGTPTSHAYDLLDRYEAIQRGRYSGPTGWVDGAGEGEFGIALRCGQFSEDAHEIRLFAGGGIMPDSTPRVELDETRAKMAPLLQALGLV